MEREADAEEAAWVGRAVAGDAAAFAQLVRRHQDRVFGFILRMTGARDEAMDLTQDTFMKAWQALPGWRPQARFGTWLLQIARNAALDALLRRQAVVFEPLDEALPVADVRPGPEEAFAARQRQLQLETALARLPHDQREIVLLREIEGLSYGELADMLGVREGTVKSRLARARAALVERLRIAGGRDG